MHRFRVGSVVAAGCLIVSGSLAVPACAQPDPGSGAAAVVRLTLDHGKRGATLPTKIRNHGAQDVVATRVTRNGGDLVVAKGRPGKAKAVRTPAYDGRANGARAVIAVTDRKLANGDGLSPGLRRFTFGADFRLDRTSVGTAYDNGNNLVQRGLAGSGAQYKLQIDVTDGGLRPSCAIAAGEGKETRSAYVQSDAIVEPHIWYSATCTRIGSQLRLVIIEYDRDGAARPPTTTTRDEIPAIDLTWSHDGPYTVLSVGGKVTAAGEIAEQSDQFNGVIDNVVLTIAPGG